MTRRSVPLIDRDFAGATPVGPIRPEDPAVDAAAER